MTQGSISIITLQPSEGYALTNGETYSLMVYLGANDSPENWWEIPIEEVPEDVWL